MVKEKTNREIILDKYLKENNLSLREWISQTGLSRDTVWHWQTKKRDNFSTKTLKALADGLEMSLAEIIEL